MRGLTMVEVLVAIAIIVIAFIPLVNLISSNAVTTVKVGNYARASGVLTKFMEELKHIPIKKFQEGARHNEWQPDRCAGGVLS